MSEDLLLETSQLLIDYGLRDLGYNYVVLDDCWSRGRGKDDYLIVDEAKFPNGMKAVSDRLHDKDLLFGMYSSAGEMTCARYGMFSLLALHYYLLTSFCQLDLLIMRNKMPRASHHGASTTSSTTIATTWVASERRSSRSTGSTRWRKLSKLLGGRSCTVFAAGERTTFIL